MLVADLASEAGIDAVAARAAAAPLDLVVNNAGIGGYRSFVELDPKVADALVSIHIRAVVQVTRAALPGMVERKRGAVMVTLARSVGAAMMKSSRLWRRRRTRWPRAARWRGEANGRS